MIHLQVLITTLHLVVVETEAHIDRLFDKQDLVHLAVVILIDCFAEFFDFSVPAG